MKTIKPLVLALAFLAQAFLVKAQNSNGSPVVNPATADDIINKHIAALGGKDKLDKLQTVIMDGSLTVQGADISVTVTLVNKKLMRQDISAMGMTGYDLMTDKEGWTFMPFQGMQKPEPKTADDVKEAQSELDITGSLYNYAAKGNKVELLGTEDVEGTSCNKLKVTLASGKEETYFLDIKSDMIVRVKEKKKINGQEIELSIDFSDYRDVDGLKMPFSMTQPFGTINFSSIKINQTIDDKLYKHE